MTDPTPQPGFTAPDTAVLAELFPGYQIDGLIATGGMGAVYCAVQKSLDRTVAIKILPRELSKDAAFCEGFEAEAKAMARLNHPNLIGVYDFGEVDGMLYIIMEYVAGQSIYHSAYGQAIDPAEVIRLVTGVCNGLAHAHENGIIHRDIKPSNILLDLSALPKIGDFGLARPVERKVQEGEEIFGTPHYTAPEVVNAPYSVDFRADIFSVGVLLHELLTGKLPAHDPRPPSAIVRCDSRFDAIVRRATHPTPSARYSSAAEMAKDLALIASTPAKKQNRGGPVAPGSPRVAMARQPRMVIHKKKSSGSSGLIIGALVLGGAALAFFLYQHGKEQSEAPPPPPPGELAAPAATRPAAPAAPVDKAPAVTPPAGELPDAVTPAPTEESPAPPSSSPLPRKAPTPAPPSSSPLPRKAPTPASPAAGAADPE